MNRKKVYDNVAKSKNTISELQDSLLIIKNSHHSNELIVNKLQTFAQSDKQVELCNALQKDMKLINNQLTTLLENLKTVKSTE